MGRPVAAIEPEAPRPAGVRHAHARIHGKYKAVGADQTSQDTRMVQAPSPPGSIPAWIRPRRMPSRLTTRQRTTHRRIVSIGQRGRLAQDPSTVQLVGVPPPFTARPPGLD
ncbi:hypothetical protein [Simplicispira suum]|uniref:hypothetical protein n=1 Tax=Simplicispira suum TaxID=2109915 RepID=UPI0011B24790|nr:hypothetical protein [Simplicispira suum]